MTFVPFPRDDMPSLSWRQGTYTIQYKDSDGPLAAAFKAAGFNISTNGLSGCQPQDPVFVEVKAPRWGWGIYWIRSIRAPVSLRAWEAPGFSHGFYTLEGALYYRPPAARNFVNVLAAWDGIDHKYFWHLIDEANDFSSGVIDGQHRASSIKMILDASKRVFLTHKWRFDLDSDFSPWVSRRRRLSIHDRIRAVLDIWGSFQSVLCALRDLKDFLIWESLANSHYSISGSFSAAAASIGVPTSRLVRDRRIHTGISPPTADANFGSDEPTLNQLNYWWRAEYDRNTRPAHYRDTRQTATKRHPSRFAAKGVRGRRPLGGCRDSGRRTLYRQSREAEWKPQLSASNCSQVEHFIRVEGWSCAKRQA